MLFRAASRQRSRNLPGARHGAGMARIAAAAGERETGTVPRWRSIAPGGSDGALRAVAAVLTLCGRRQSAISLIGSLHPGVRFRSGRVARDRPATGSRSPYALLQTHGIVRRHDRRPQDRPTSTPHVVDPAKMTSLPAAKRPAPPGTQPLRRGRVRMRGAAVACCGSDERDTIERRPGPTAGRRRVRNRTAPDRPMPDDGRSP